MERSQSKTEVSSTAATKEGAEDTYEKHRKHPNQYWDKCRQYEIWLERTWNREHYTLAKHFHKKMKKNRARAVQEDKVAVQKIFKDNNKSRVYVLRDVHGMHPKGATVYVDQALETMGRSHKVVADLVFITGQGKHSKDRIGGVKEAVIEFLRENGIPWDYFVNEGGIVNKGRIAIELVNACNYKSSEVKDDKGPGPVDAQRMEEVTAALNPARTKDLITFPNVMPDNTPYRCTNKCVRIDVVDS